MIGWRPGIGDPSLLGWLTVAAYVAAALLSFRTYRLVEPVEPVTREGILTARVQRWFWLGMTVVLGALAINKQLDIQSLLTDIARVVFKKSGWYEGRRVFQHAFVLVAAGTGAVAILAGLWAFRKGGAWVQLGQLGLIALCSFIVVRAASFHDVDAMLGGSVWFFKLNHVLELSGIAVISIAAVGAGARG
jgi:hypothetical protein